MIEKTNLNVQRILRRKCSFPFTAHYNIHDFNYFFSDLLSTQIAIEFRIFIIQNV